MNYIRLINHFWELNEVQPLNTVETRLYFYLLHISNRSYWHPSLEQSDPLLARQVGISINSLKKARQQLLAQNLIEFTSGGRGYAHKSRYQIVTPKLPSRCQTVTPKYGSLPIKRKENSMGNKNTKNLNTKIYDRHKGFVYTGSDFD